MDAQEHAVEVAVESHLDHLHRVTGRRALLPQPALARVEPRPAGLAGLRPRLLVHVREHQHLAAVGVLDHGRDEALREIGAHRRTSTPIEASSCLTPPIESSPKWNTDAASAASAPPAVRASYMCRAEPAPPEAITGRRTASLTARVSGRS